MRVSIPHSLGRDEACTRIRAREHELANLVPALVKVGTSWPDENRMAINVSAMGQGLQGMIEIEDEAMVFTLDLPPALSFAEPMVRGAIEAKAGKLLS